MPSPKDPIKREEWKKHISESHLTEDYKEKFNTKEFKEKMSSVTSGEKNGMFGKHHSDETCTLISELKRGKIPPPFTEEHIENMRIAQRGRSGEKSPMFGRKHTKETRNLMSIKASGKNNPMYGRSGEKSPMWKGGVSFEPYCYMFNRPFKNRVRARYDYVCVECGKTQEEKGRLLDVHHVNYDKMVCCNSTKPLFVALCHSCNSKANGNRDYWEKYYTEIINEKYDGICYLPEEIK